MTYTENTDQPPVYMYYPAQTQEQFFRPSTNSKGMKNCFIKSWAAIFLGLGLFPLIFIAVTLSSSESCIRIKPLITCHVDQAISIFADDFSSVQLYWSLSYLDDSGSKVNGWDILNTSNLNVYSDFLRSFPQNSTHDCSLLIPETNKMMLRDCNFFALFVFVGIALIWFITFVILMLVCHRKRQEEQQQRNIQQQMQNYQFPEVFTPTQLY